MGVCVCVGPLGEKDGEGRTSPLCPHPYHKKKGGASLLPRKNHAHRARGHRPCPAQKKADHRGRVPVPPKTLLSPTCASLTLATCFAPHHNHRHAHFPPPFRRARRRTLRKPSTAPPFAPVGTPWAQRFGPTRPFTRALRTTTCTAVRPWTCRAPAQRPASPSTCLRHSCGRRWRWASRRMASRAPATMARSSTTCSTNTMDSHIINSNFINIPRARARPAFRNKRWPNGARWAASSASL